MQTLLRVLRYGFGTSATAAGLDSVVVAALARAVHSSHSDPAERDACHPRATLLMLVVARSAGYWPAHRALRTDPRVALAYA